MKNRVNPLLEKINTSDIPEEARVIIYVEDINDVEDNNVDNDNYVSALPQDNLEYLEYNNKNIL